MSSSLEVILFNLADNHLSTSYILTCMFGQVFILVNKTVRSLVSNAAVRTILIPFPRIFFLPKVTSYAMCKVKVIKVIKCQGNTKGCISVS